MIEQFKSARNAGVPILAIETFDPQQTIRTIAKSINGNSPVIQWDGIRGLIALNKPGSEVVNQICRDQDPSVFTNPSETLAKLPVVPENSLIFMMNINRFMNHPESGIYVTQGIWNLRDIYKSKGVMLILLSPAISLPDELKQDVMVISEPLPGISEIEGIVKSISKDAGMEEPKSKELTKIADTLLGLSAFAAEQTLATCIKKTEKGKIGINQRNLWERKCSQIEQTKGLSIWKGSETFNDVKGCENAKLFLNGILSSGKKNFRAIVLLDEFEKATAGALGDSSGVSQDLEAVILREMQDNEVFGVMFIGPPGSGKSLVSKASGNTYNIPDICFDLGGMKEKFVGASGTNVRTAFKVVQAVSQGNALFIATCNSLGVLSSAMRRRFSLIFFFDLLTKEERPLVWDYYIKRYQLSSEQNDPVDNTDWTGAEIKKCCEIAWLLNYKLSEASKFIVPVAKSSFDEIDNLRKSASGKYISASYSGLYEGLYERKTEDFIHEAHRAIK